MKSIEKKMLVLLIFSSSLAIGLWLIPPPEGPTTIREVIPFVLFIWGALMSGLGIFISSAVFIGRGIIRLKRKYRDRCEAYRRGLPIKFPAFFKFMKWLNTDD